MNDAFDDFSALSRTSEMETTKPKPNDEMPVPRDAYIRFMKLAPAVARVDKLQIEDSCDRLPSKWPRPEEGKYFVYVPKDVLAEFHELIKLTHDAYEAFKAVSAMKPGSVDETRAESVFVYWQNMAKEKLAKLDAYRVAAFERHQSPIVRI